MKNEHLFLSQAKCCWKRKLLKSFLSDFLTACTKITLMLFIQLQIEPYHTSYISLCIRHIVGIIYLLMNFNEWFSFSTVGLYWATIYLKLFWNTIRTLMFYTRNVYVIITCVIHKLHTQVRGKEFECVSAL